MAATIFGCCTPCAAARARTSDLPRLAPSLLGWLFGLLLGLLLRLFRPHFESLLLGLCWVFARLEPSNRDSTRDPAKGSERGPVVLTEFGAKNKILSIPFDFSWDKIWREKLSLCLVQIEIHLFALLSFCTKPRKSFSRQIFSREGGGTNQVESTIYLQSAKLSIGDK